MKPIHFSDPDEQYIFDERIAILAENREPTSEQIAMAIGDVWRARNERRAHAQIKNQSQTELLL